MTIELFNSLIPVKAYYCALDGMKPLKIDDPYVNIYVTLTNKCNACCKFCCNENNRCFDEPFDIQKFKQVIQEVNNKVKIHKLSFTGGEPTLNLPLLSDCLSFVKSCDNNIFITVNTNGFNLDALGTEHKLIDSISLSRHHYDDDKCREIFGVQNILTSEKIKTFKHKDILHLSCNLMKNYIGCEAEIVKYLNFASSVGVNDIGFVTLMDVNNYCEKEFVDFASLNFETFDNVFVSKDWNNNNICRCRNYLYIADSSDVVRVYSRYYVNRKNSEGTLVYDGKYLRIGFNGPIVI